MKIARVGTGVNIGPLLWALQSNPQLWDAIDGRTATPESPHHGTHDIWCRYADQATQQPDGSHESMWYPPANVLPIKMLCEMLMIRTNGVKLGGVLITKIPPGAAVKPHTDPGWHARYYDKFAVQVASHPLQAFCFDDEQLTTRPGDVFWFDNSQEHWVTNESDEARITLIVCIRKGEL